MIGSDLEGADPESWVASWAASGISDDAAAARAVIKACADRLPAADAAGFVDRDRPLACCPDCCSFWNARGPLEDHAVHVPADDQQMSEQSGGGCSGI